MPETRARNSSELPNHLKARSRGRAPAKRHRRRQADAMRVYVKLFRATESVTSRLAGLISASGLTFTQFNVLESLKFAGPMRQRELSGKVMRSNGNMTLVLRNLERNGLVERTRVAGTRRELTVALTTQGTRLIDKLFPRFAAAVAQEMAVLDDHELAQLGELCRRVGLQLKRRSAPLAQSKRAGKAASAVEKALSD